MSMRSARDDLENLLAAMFALLTARLEDAAGLAGTCQARLGSDRLRTEIGKLDGIITEATTICAAIAALLEEGH